MSIFISVVIPTYKRPDLLLRCLDAIRAQIFPQSCFEINVVSDGPDSMTANLVQEVNAQNPNFPVRYYELPEKKGPAAARNFGWKQGVGELVIFTDDDCLPSPLWLEDYWQAYKNHGKSIISFTGKVIVPVPDNPTDYQKNVSHLATADFITANCACSREALKFVNGFDEDFPAAWREDSALEFELLEHQVPIVKLSDAQVTHPVREAPWGVSIHDQRKSMFNALLFKKYPAFYRKKISSQPAWNYYVIIFFSLVALCSFLLNEKITGLVALGAWIIAIGAFAYKRLQGTDESLSHRMEMILTSILIPYLSVYWTLRGALRYKVFFL